MKHLLLSLLAVLTIPALAAAAEAPAPAIRRAPEVAFNIPNQGQKLLSQYRGKVIALEFIFTTCPHCQAASRMMTQFQQQYGPRGFQALDVAFNDNADLKVADFVHDFQVGFPVGWTTRDEVLAFLGLSTVDRFVVPQIILIDRNGMIHYQTKPLGTDEDSYQEATIRHRIDLLLDMPALRARAATARRVHQAVARR